jgi:tetratricopeptide (TPR) repeat protein
LTDQNAPDVAEICRKLDGIPLALELAASKMNLLTPGQLLERMTGQFAVLESTALNIDPKHRTLWSALAWSYDSLSPAESALFRRLAVFEDHFTIEAVEGVFESDDGLSGEQTMPLLAQLLDKSLITVRDRSNGPREFRLYAAVREFAHAKLKEAGEHDEASRRHCEWYYSVVSQAADEIEGPNQGLWLRRFEDDYDNFRAALAWCLATSTTSKQTCNFCYALLPYWSMRGLQHEGRLFIEESIAKFGLDDLQTIVCQHVNAACLAEYEGKNSIALQHLERAIALCEGAGYKRGMAGALGNLAVVLAMEGRFSESTDATTRAVAIWDETGDVANYWFQKANLVDSLNALGRHNEALRLGEEVLEASRRLGVANALPLAQQHLAEAYIACGQSEKAEILLEEAIDSHRGVDAANRVGRLMRPLAQVAIMHGQYERAAVYLAAASVLTEGDGTVQRSAPSRAATERLICDVRLALGENFELCWEHGLEMDVDEVASFALGTDRGVPTYRRRPG